MWSVWSTWLKWSLSVDIGMSYLASLVHYADDVIHQHCCGDSGLFTRLSSTIYPVSAPTSTLGVWGPASKRVFARCFWPDRISLHGFMLDMEDSGSPLFLLAGSGDLIPNIPCIWMVQQSDWSDVIIFPFLKSDLGTIVLMEWPIVVIKICWDDAICFTGLRGHRQ